jgi:hypothetical protein
MPLNTNLIMGYQPAQIESPVNQLAKVLQIQGAQQANELNQQKMDEYSRGVAQQNRLLQLTQGIPADAIDEDRVKAYRVGGFHDQADKLETAIGTRAKTAADVAKTKSETDYKAIETAHKKADLAGQVFGYVRQNPTPENAIAAIEHLTNVGMYTPEQAQAHIAKIQANPQNVAQMADLAYRGALSAKDQLPKLQALNAGDAQVNQSVDPVTGLVRETGRTTINQSADNKANNARIAAEGAANRGVQIRGQNLTDARQREANAAALAAKGDKPLTEGQAKSALFGSRMKMANEIFDTLEKSGTTTSTPGINSGYGVGNVVSALSSSDQQQLLQAKRDFLNAVLRRESGAVIGESEFDSGNKQYFPQVGDNKQVIAQKRANREAAMRGVLVDIPENRRSEIIGEITGTKAGGATGGFDGPAKGGFKYLGTE